VLGVAISRSTAARLVIDRLLLRMPFVGTLNAEYNLARYARTLGSLLQAGVPMLGALTSANSILSNSYMATALAESLNDVRDGQNLGRALSGRPGIPMLALRMISVGEETGRLGDMLLRVAVVTEQQSHSRIERVMTLLTPALTVAVAGFVGALIFTVMNAILSVNELAVQ
jgi:general secretion pathway protein F